MIRKFPLIAFYILAFLISWLGWVPQTLYARGLLPVNIPLLGFLGGAGPTLAAIIVTWALYGSDGPRQLFAGLGKWRASWTWYALVFVFWFVVAGLALLLMSLRGHSLPSLGGFAWVSLFPIFLTMLLSNVWEEIGWRGFALPRLQERFGDLTIAFLMGLLWWAWHLPLYLDPTSPMSTLPWYGEIVFSLALTVLYTWIYNQTRGSLVFVTIFHAMSNTIAFLLLQIGVFQSSYLFVVGLTAVAALAIVLVCGPRRFVRPADL